MIDLLIEDGWKQRHKETLGTSEFLIRLCTFLPSPRGTHWVPIYAVLNQIVRRGKLAGPGASLHWKGFALAEDTYAAFTATLPDGLKMCPATIDTQEKWSAWRAVGGDTDAFEKYYALAERLQSIFALLQARTQDVKVQHELMEEAIRIQQQQKDVLRLAGK